MYINIQGEMNLAEIRQALVETLHQVEDEFAVRHSRGALLIIRLTNGFGDKVKPRYANGQEVKKINCRGPYRSAADDYEPY
ncbi:MAG: hypothetical protein QNI84_17420 [Henriciella sp.]|nr:hypothetical protein [Henriciella sp.]